jgi:general secretion pathway protein I
MRGRGFTLIEVMVALVVLALVLGAAMRVTVDSVVAAEQMKLRMLAAWVARDRVALHLAGAASVSSTRAGAAGSSTSSGMASQAGIVFVWREEVHAVAAHGLNEVAVGVTLAGRPEHVLARFIGFMVEPAP